ncbi:MAG: hypothetical protein ACP5HX_11775, partial [Thermoproteota archaeon]
QEHKIIFDCGLSKYFYDKLADKEQKFEPLAEWDGQRFADGRWHYSAYESPFGLFIRGVWEADPEEPYDEEKLWFLDLT